MNKKLRSAADLVLSFSPVILMVSLLWALLTSSVKEEHGKLSRKPGKEINLKRSTVYVKSSPATFFFM